MPKSATPKAKEGLVQALFEFDYDEKLGKVARGQVFEPGRHINVERMLNLRFITPVPKGTTLYECGECGRLFIDDSCRTAHGDQWHQYECQDCGWVAGRMFPDRRGALERHRLECSSAIAATEKRRMAHMKEIADIKAPEPVAISA